jgi:heat shock protein HslJ
MFSRSVGLTLLIFAACPVLADPLPGSEWSPVEIDTQPFESQTDVFIRFEQDGRFFGNGGCNTFRGKYLVNGAAILFGPAAATMMVCPGDISQKETWFLQSLDTIRAFERDGIDLTLTNAAGEIVIRLRQRDAD